MREIKLLTILNIVAVIGVIASAWTLLDDESFMLKLVVSLVIGYTLLRTTNVVWQVKTLKRFTDRLSELKATVPDVVKKMADQQTEKFVEKRKQGVFKHIANNLILILAVLITLFIVKCDGALRGTPIKTSTNVLVDSCDVVDEFQYTSTTVICDITASHRIMLWRNDTMYWYSIARTSINRCHAMDDSLFTDALNDAMERVENWHYLKNIDTTTRKWYYLYYKADPRWYTD